MHRGVPYEFLFKSWPYDSLAGIGSSNSCRGGGRGAWIPVSCDCYVCLRWADHSSRGALPIVVCLGVIVKSGQWVGPGSAGLWSGQVPLLSKFCCIFRPSRPSFLLAALNNTMLHGMLNIESLQDMPHWNCLIIVIFLFYQLDAQNSLV